MRTNLPIVFMSIFILITVSHGGHADYLKLEHLKKLCLVEPIREGNRHICPICPDFTDFAGENYDKFMITQVIEGNFISGKRAKFVGYFGCEPKVRYYGGYVILVREGDRAEKLLIDEEREYLGRCRKILKKDRDFLECKGGDAYQGRPKSWKVLCEIKDDGSLKCKKC